MTTNLPTGQDDEEEEYAVLTNLTEQQTALAPLFRLADLPADQQPAAVYIGGLGNEDSKRTMRAALYDIVRIIIPESEGDVEEQPKRKRTREQMKAERQMREQIIFHFPWGQLRYQHTAIIRAKLDARYKYTTANRYLAALRMVLFHAMLLGQMPVDDYQRTKVVKNIRGSSLPKGRSLKPGEIDDLINGCLDDERIHGCRDLAIILVLFSTGIRRAECANLNVEDYDQETHELKINKGKGNKERTVYVESVAGYTALGTWIERRGKSPGPMFCPIERGQHFGRVKAGAPKEEDAGWVANPLARLSEEGVYYILKQRAYQAGIRDLSPHDFRRNMIGVLFDHNVDVSTMMRLTGHSNIATLVGYDRRPERAKRAAAAVMSAPVARWQPKTQPGSVQERLGEYEKQSED